MTLAQIEIMQKKISKTLREKIHPDNLLAVEVTKRYRELEELKKLV